MMERNRAVSQLLDDIARLLTIRRDDPYRIRAYTEAARAIEALPVDIQDVHRAGQLEQLPAVGESIARKISEFLDTGYASYYEALKYETAPEAAGLLDVPSIGPGRARVIHEHLGISRITELEQAARDHRLRDLPGFGAALEERIARDAARVRRERAAEAQAR